MRRTCFAIATPPGRGAIAIVRISGPSAGSALEALSAGIPSPRQAMLRTLRDPDDGAELDKGLVLWFPGPDSVTGEDVAELHLHGGVAVSASVIDVLSRLTDFRPAEPGEFTRRAFENGRMDLTEAEAVADLVAAETRGQQSQALRQMQGALGRLYEGWRGRLVRSLAHLEAALDFPEEDLPETLIAGITPDLESVAAEIAAHLDDGGRGERLRDGVQVAILGPPNAGKSSLLNTLARRDAAIVSERAGTTRDVIEVHLDLGGLPVILLDTAGIRAAGDEIEEEGVRRAQQRARDADLRVLVFDATEEPDPAVLALAGEDSVTVVNKVDLTGERSEFTGIGAAPVVPVSVKTGRGIAALESWLSDWAAAHVSAGSAPALTRARHRTALEDCRDSLGRAVAAGEVELAAEDLRLAVRALGRITGRVDVEDLLDVIFRDFCIGK